MVTRLTLLRSATGTALPAIPSLSSCRWLRQYEDPALSYLFTDASNGATDNDALRQELQDAGFTEVKSILVNVALDDVPFDSPMLSIGYHFVRDENRARLVPFFESVRCILDAYVTVGRAPVGGWADGEEECWVLFTGWRDWHEHLGFLQAPRFDEYRGILRLLKRYESFHASEPDKAVESA